MRICAHVCAKTVQSKVRVDPHCATGAHNVHQLVQSKQGACTAQWGALCVPDRHLGYIVYKLIDKNDYVCVEGISITVRVFF